MKIETTLHGLSKIVIYRDQNGIPQIDAQNESDLYYGLGYCHAIDRGLCLLLMRTVAEGRCSEFLEANDETLEIDVMFRKLNWRKNISGGFALLPDEIQTHCKAYCRGINDGFSKRVPWELRFIRHPVVEWKIEDSILLSRITSYMIIHQSQIAIEQVLLNLIQKGVSRKKLDELFPEILSGLDEDLVKKVILPKRFFPENISWQNPIPVLSASNNWVISGTKTESRMPILASDPHLEINRLPNIFYEAVLKLKNRFVSGATLPGVPSVLIGRTPDLAWGVTYSYMDTCDSWVEECKNGAYLRGQEWYPFEKRKEMIHRKKKTPIEKIFYENQLGVLEGDPFYDGFYLVSAWSGMNSGFKSLEAFFKIFHAQNVQDGMALLGKVETSWNWVFADQQGNIGYQMSGLLPKRVQGWSGFYPISAADENNHWKGYYEPDLLPRVYNPKEGFFVTANNDLNSYGKVKPINICMGSHRSDRISDVLKRDKKFNVENIFELQKDVFSNQAKHFMEHLKPLLPNSYQAKILKDWDYRYHLNSKGAFLFEAFYHNLIQEVFGGAGVYLKDDSSIFAAYYWNFDRVLLSKHSEWFNGEKRETLYKKALTPVLKMKPENWGKHHQARMNHLLLGGKLPLFLGFDKGPVPLAGGRATVSQGQIFKQNGKVTSFAPAIRVVTDLSEDKVYSNMAGGPSDRRFSKWYASDLKNWLKGKYKKLEVKI